MKLTKTRLKQIIKEELQKVLSEERSMEFSDEEGTQATVSLSPRAALQKLSQKHGGVRGILKLDSNDPDRVAYRKAYKQLKQDRAAARTPFNPSKGAPDRTKSLGKISDESPVDTVSLGQRKKQFPLTGGESSPLDPLNVADAAKAARAGIKRPDPLDNITVVDDPNTIRRAAATTKAERENPLGTTSGAGRRRPRGYADPAKVKPAR